MKFPLIELIVQSTTLGTFFKIWKEMETTLYMVCPLHAKPTNEQILIFKDLCTTSLGLHKDYCVQVGQWG
jgi:hypothetical protein